MRPTRQQVETWMALAVCGLVFWLSLRALDHASTWPAPATPQQYRALEPLIDRP